MLFKDIIATAGIDTNAIVFDRPSGQIVSTRSGHSKKVCLFFLIYSENQMELLGIDCLHITNCYFGRLQVSKLFSKMKV